MDECKGYSCESFVLPGKRPRSSEERETYHFDFISEIVLKVYFMRLLIKQILC